MLLGHISVSVLLVGLVILCMPVNLQHRPRKEKVFRLDVPSLRPVLEEVCVTEGSALKETLVLMTRFVPPTTPVSSLTERPASNVSIPVTQLNVDPMHIVWSIPIEQTVSATNHLQEILMISRLDVLHSLLNLYLVQVMLPVEMELFVDQLMDSILVSIPV